MSIATVGQTAMLLAVVGSVWATCAGCIGTRAAEAEHWLRRARTGLRVAVVASLVASLVLVLALIAGDYSLAYVVAHTSNDLSAGLRFTAWWSGQAGSLLLWLAILVAYGWLMVRGMRAVDAAAQMQSGAIGILSSVAAFFAVLCAFIARPFELASRLPPDGSGMSPALQNYWMAIHPPALYLGYVAVAVPFALVMGAALARDRSDAWVLLARRWMMVAWIGLSAGLVLGARWAYEEIGWGGYWAWDPVENAALMPWLTATAFLHTIMVQQRRGLMRLWNAGIVTLTFGLSILGTFITRSGVLSSVHSFVSSSVGWWFIGLLAVSMLGSIVLLARSRALRGHEGSISGVVTRETAFLFNSLLLVAIALTVLWGVLFPLVSAALTGSREALQASWFNFFLAAFGFPLLLLMAVGNEIPWRGTTARRILRRLGLPMTAGVLAGVVAVWQAGTDTPAGAAGVSFGTLVTMGVLADVTRTVRARRSSTGEQLLIAVRGVARKQRRRLGGHVAHAGVGLLAIAICGGAMGTTEVSDTVSPGQRVSLGSWTLTYTDVTRERTASAMQVRAQFTVDRDGSQVGSLTAGRNFYPASGEVSNEIGLHRDLATVGDLFVAVDRLGEDGKAAITVITNPLINLLWIAGVLVMVGGMIAGWPSRQRDRSSGPSGAIPASRGARASGIGTERISPAING